jgi:2,3-bisphosphoglycerate-independent phosphoglycerate mutase
MNKKVALIIMDGWGHGDNPEVSAIAQANTPFVDSLYKNYVNSELEASGLAVGLPDGQMGNSEVGHMNIGAGRVVYQDLVKINLAVENNTLKDEAEIKAMFEYAKANDKAVHLFGLVSDGGVHAHINHLKGLTSIASDLGIDKVYIHAFTDGRDTDPKGGKAYMEDLESHLLKTTGKVASLIGRYYAMDRDNRWERVELAYDAMVKGEGDVFTSSAEAINAAYASGVTDEFIKPSIITEDGAPIAKIEKGDVAMCFNFRTDRGREITQALTQKDFPDQEMKALDLYYVTMTNYDESFKGIKVVYRKDNLAMTLGEVLSKADKQQIRIAETEKYPHVTFFFSGGQEEAFKGEKRLLAPSPKVATYDLQPEMSAFDIRDKINPELEKGDADFVCLNFANPDMVGHTGVFEAAVKACETVDSCVESVITTGLENGYTFIIIADHGNSDVMKNADGSPNTAHTTNLVPCILVDKEYKEQIKNGKLGDLAPTILNLMGIEIPREMTGDSLL